MLEFVPVEIRAVRFITLRGIVPALAGTVPTCLSGGSSLCPGRRVNSLA
jgi:hypothetical protein